MDSIKIEGENVDITRFDGDTVLMDNCETLRYRQFNAYCGSSRDRVHVSTNGGDMVPFFMGHSWIAKERDIELFNVL